MHFNVTTKHYVVMSENEEEELSRKMEKFSLNVTTIYVLSDDE